MSKLGSSLESMESAIEIDISDNEKVSISSVSGGSYQLAKSVMTHDFNIELNNDVDKMEEVGCFDHLPNTDRFNSEDQAGYAREAAWIAKRMMELPKATELYSRKELAKTIQKLLPVLLDQKLSVIPVYSASSYHGI